MAKETKGKEVKVKNPQSIGLADAEATAFFEPDPGRYLAEFSDAPQFIPADEGNMARFVFPFHILEGETAEGEEVSGRYWRHSIFVPPMPEDPDEEGADQIIAWRKRVLSNVKSIFTAAGVQIKKDKNGFDVWNGADFLGKRIRINCKYVIDRETGEPRLNKRGVPIKNFFFSAAPQEEEG
jgi:hypothetical protein